MFTFSIRQQEKLNTIHYKMSYLINFQKIENFSVNLDIVLCQGAKRLTVYLLLLHWKLNYIEGKTKDK